MVSRTLHGVSNALLKVELQVNEVVNVLIHIVNFHHVPSDGHVMIVARGTTQSMPKSQGYRIDFLPQVGIKRRTNLKA
jgi:hypothetical protein